MTLARTRRCAVTVAVAALMTWASAERSNAQVAPVPAPVNGIASSADCTHDRINDGPTGIPGDGQGRTGGTQDDLCQDQGIQFTGPSVGQVAAVIGPTIIGGTVDTPIQVGPGSHSVTPAP